MFFSVGVSKPEHDDEAFGIVVPALCNDSFGCYSAADTQEEIPVMAREAISLIVEEMVIAGAGVEEIKDAGFMVYSASTDYADYNSWFVLEVDLSAFEGKQQRINIVLPDTLISRIDNRVKSSSGHYRDRSHFLSEAARKELSSH